MIEKNGNRYSVTGPMLIAGARVLLEAGRGFLLDEPGSEVILDLASVEEVDSSALGVLFALLRSARERGMTLRVANPPSSLISLAGLYGVSDSLPLA